MALFTFWRGDDIRTPKRTNDISIQKEFNTSLLGRLMNQDEQRIERRFRDGNEAWVLSLEDMPISFGWVGRERARIGELSKEIEIPKGNSYLWNFRTLEPHRGRGYYVQLLTAILREEEEINDRIWIISAPENQSSFNGIVKTGFRSVGDIMFDYKNEVVLCVSSMDERTEAGAQLLNIAITTTAVRPCWRCASKAMNKEASCDCYENHLPCRCNSKNAATNTGKGSISKIVKQLIVD